MLWLWLLEMCVAPWPPKGGMLYYQSMNTFTKKNIITACCLVAFAIVSRLLMHGQNYETLTAVTVIAGALLGPALGLAVGLLSVIGSDIIIGNSPILLFTWSAWTVIGLANALWYKRFSTMSLWQGSAVLTGSGLASTLFFYLWTNFGMWLVGPSYKFLIYPMTWSGLVQCYVAAIPFLRNQIVGNVFIVPVVAGITIAAYRYLPSLLKQRSWMSKPLPKTLS